MTRLAALICVVALGIVVWWFGFGGERPLHERAPTTTREAAPPYPQSPQHAEQAAIRDGNRPAAHYPTTVSNSALDELHSSTDLLLFLEKWEISATHDPEAALAIGLALQECATPAIAGDAGFRKLFEQTIQALPDSATKIDGAISKTLSRCSNLVRLRKIDNLNPGAAALQTAAAAGNTRAQALTLDQYLEKNGVEGTRSHIADLIGTGDPEVLLDMASFATFNAATLFPPGSTLHQLQDQQWALQLAACELGYDCSVSSPLLRQACLWHLPCNAQSVAELVQSMLAPVLYPGQRQLAARIAAEIRAGRAEGLLGP